MSKYDILEPGEEISAREMIRDLGIAMRWVDAFDAPGDLKIVLPTLNRGQQIAARLIELGKRGNEKVAANHAYCQKTIAKAEVILKTKTDLTGFEDHLADFHARMNPISHYQKLVSDIQKSVIHFHKASRRWTKK